MDIIEFLKTLRVPGYENNLPAGGPPRQPRLPAGPALTMGDVRAQEATKEAAGALAPDLHAYTEEQPEDPLGAFRGGRDRLRAQRAKIEAARSREQDALESRRYLGQDTVEGMQRKFAGTTPGSPDWFARLTGEDRSTTIDPAAAAPRPSAAIAYEDTELRRGVPPPPHGDSPGGAGGPTTETKRAKQWQDLVAPSSAAEIAAMKLIKDAASRGQARTEYLPLAEPMNSQSSLENVVRGALDGGDAETVGAPARRLGLDERYADRAAKIPRDDGGQLTEQQKGEAQLEFFLSMLANNRPGSGFLQNAGAAGLSASGRVRQDREGNRRNAAARRREALDEVYKEVLFADRDEDNQAGRERLGLLKQQLEQGKWTVKDTDDGVVLIDLRSGQTKPVTGADGKPLKLSTKDNRPAAVKLVEYLEGLPDDRRTRALEWLQTGKSKSESDQLIAAATKLLEPDMYGTQRTPEQALEEARRLVLGAKGQAAPAPAIQKPDPVANKGRTISGPDGRFRSDGRQWVRIQ